MRRDEPVARGGAAGGGGLFAARLRRFPCDFADRAPRSLSRDRGADLAANASVRSRRRTCRTIEAQLYEEVTRTALLRRPFQPCRQNARVTAESISAAIAAEDMFGATSVDANGAHDPATGGPCPADPGGDARRLFRGDGRPRSMPGDHYEQRVGARWRRWRKRCGRGAAAAGALPRMPSTTEASARLEQGQRKARRARFLFASAAAASLERWIQPNFRRTAPRRGIGAADARY